jgi:hypothetical protein
MANAAIVYCWHSMAAVAIYAPLDKGSWRIATAVSGEDLLSDENLPVSTSPRHADLSV